MHVRPAATEPLNYRRKAPGRTRDRPRLCTSSLRQTVIIREERRRREGLWGEEFHGDFHSASPAALNLQRERERGPRLDVVVQEALLSPEAAAAVCASEMSIKSWVVFRFAEARREPRGVVGDAAHYVFSGRCRFHRCAPTFQEFQSAFNLPPPSPNHHPHPSSLLPKLCQWYASDRRSTTRWRTAKKGGRQHQRCGDRDSWPRIAGARSTPHPNMSSQTKVKKDKEIIAEYETQVKGGWRAGLLPLLFCMWGHTIA